MERIVKLAGDELFNTPIPTVIPTDSFAADYEPDEMKAIEADLGLVDIDKINNFAKKVQISLEQEIKQGQKKKRNKFKGMKVG